MHCIGNTWWLSNEESACNEEHASSIPGLGRSPGEGNSNPITCLGNLMEREA